ncbi:uncharacterized protein LOC111051832 isoform X2 [Nilaparvata lugens]|uniref:uncharacterized protein LOC111051832 isoform X1 n=1 Tax=Nilaparvata lugens TaxID=108931 RepID=UPI00193DDEA0|nr:uncharacterized protein LOC111051832 isoform X1 [Nilaparvata lugens]XP_039288132.1 uncharacterized protein LOC111051832 isoform X2 [Nilaparvata lugens]
MDDLKNLIDWSSPENKSNETNRNLPLIPCPSTAPLISNPFDSICEQLQVKTPDDPFEAVLTTAMCYKKTDNHKNQRKTSNRKSDERERCEEKENVPTPVEYTKVSVTNYLNNLVVTETPSPALPDEKDADENKENCDPFPEKTLDKIEDISILKGIDRSPLSEISVDKLYHQDETCPYFLVEEDELPCDEVDDMLTGSPLRSKMEVAANEAGMKGKKCQSVPQLFVENDKRQTTAANNTFCGGDFDELEGFKPLGEALVSSSFSVQSPARNGGEEMLSVTCDQMNSKVNFRTASAPSLSTPKIENFASGHRNSIFSSDLSPVLNNGVPGSSSSSTYSFMNRGMLLSKTNGSDSSFISRKVERNIIVNNNCADEDNDDVFVEAKILSQSFSQSVHVVDDKVDEVADLFAVEMNLVHANSSDEENDSLRNDPSLNFNFTSPATRQKSFVEFSEAVKKYKKRRSTDPLFSSTDALDESQDESSQKKSASFSSSETPKTSKNRNRSSPTSITAGLNLLKKQIDSLPIGNNILQVQKPKKDEGGVCTQKAAPLKATVPLQFMIRSGINKDIGQIDKKTVAIKPITQSKVRAATRMKAQKNVTTPRPVASSTPNKNKSVNASHGQSLIMEDNHKNRSLDSSDGFDQKKTSRSSSLSSIPSSEKSLKAINGKENSTPTRNGLSVRNSMPIMKQANKKLSALSRNSPQLGARSTLLSPSSTSSVRKYGKLPPKINWGQLRYLRDKENLVPIQ